MAIYIIDDSTRDEVLFREDVARGWEPESGPEGGFAAMAGVEPVPQSLIIPTSEWQARIEEREKLGLGLGARRDAAKIPVKMQSMLNYCWGFATVTACEMTRLGMNEPYVALSPCSVCTPITNGQNRGGYGTEAIDRIANYGIVPESEWPQTANDRRLATPANLALAQKYRCTRWCAPQTWEEYVSLALHNIAGSIGYNWWRHQICWLDVVWLDGEVCPRILNSHSEQYGDNGTAIIQGRRKYPNDGVCPLFMRAA